MDCLSFDPSFGLNAKCTSFSYRDSYGLHPEQPICTWPQSEDQYDSVFLSLGRRGETGCLYNPVDVGFASRYFRANCGPAAFAAATRQSVCSSITAFPKFPDRPWTTKGDMERALAARSIAWTPTENCLPRYGLALVQLLGPWMNLRNPCAALTRTHWVGVYLDCFYDINWDGWLPRTIWEKLIFRAIKRQYRGTSGWKPVTGFEFKSKMSFDELSIREQLVS
jgi:hypothetical protein